MPNETPIGPKQRVWRTVYQTVIAVGVAVPTAAALLPINAAQSAWAVGISGAIVVLVSAAQNAWNAHS